jgi:hypothetical protein
MILWRRVQRRAAQMDPELASAILRAFARVRDAMSESQIVRALTLGGEERLFQDVLKQAVMDVAFQPVRDQMRTGVRDAFRYHAADLPKPPTGSTLTVSFDFLNPKVLDAIRTLETRVITSLSDSIRETVRAKVEAGLLAGVNPRETARELRPLIGLGPSQLKEVQNYRDALNGVNGRQESDYTLRDKRYGLGKDRTPEQIDRMVATYTKRRIALNAETVARTAALDAQKLGQQLAWSDAVERGVVDGDRLRKQWVTVLDGRERPEHHDMNGSQTGYDQPYSNGDNYAGEGDPWNCRCIDRYFVAVAP